MTLITSAVSMSEEEHCRDMFESFIKGLSMQPPPQYCRGVSRFNNVLKLTSPITVIDSSLSLSLFFIYTKTGCLTVINRVG